ncbi:MAG: 4-(cytidine 5'-diphospho)-2-C-methyl-D-erythritol kinase [Bosea sp. (in: a-proteobacteria)]
MSASPLTARAPAKINLTLRVLARRADGYHELSSLVMFAGTGDTLSLAPGNGLSLDLSGPEAAACGDTGDNLVIKAARALVARKPSLRLGHFHLVKLMPVASGMGGGSADAAAALRLLSRLNSFSLADPALFEAALATGADVPVCLRSQACEMSGIGDRLGPKLALPKLFAVLANPRVPVATADVFRKLGLVSGATKAGAEAQFKTTSWPGSAPELIDAIAASRNDLEAPAMALAPAIGETLDALRAQPGALLARMSGSGATCFALFADCRQSAAAAKAMALQKPGWWVKATVLR